MDENTIKQLVNLAKDTSFSKEQVIEFISNCKKNNISDEEIKKYLTKKIEKEKKNKKTNEKKEEKKYEIKRKSQKLSPLKIIFLGIMILVIGLIIFFYLKNYNINNFSTEVNTNLSDLFSGKETYKSNEYYFYDPSSDDEIKRDENKIVFRNFQSIAGELLDLTNYAKQFPISYRKESETDKYRISTIRLLNYDLQDIYVEYYNIEGKEKQTVNEDNIQIFDIEYPNFGKTTTLVLDNITLKKGTYCFKLYAKNSKNNNIESDEICKYIGPYHPLEDRVDLRTNQDKNQVTIQIIDFNLEKYNEVVLDYNIKIYLGTKENPQIKEITNDLKNQNLEFNITDSNKLRYFVQKEKEFIDMTQTNQVGEELEGIEDMPIREEE